MNNLKDEISNSTNKNIQKLLPVWYVLVCLKIPVLFCKAIINYVYLCEMGETLALGNKN